MKVTNIHQRELVVTLEQAGNLIDSLASKDDRLWPHGTWPRMTFDRPLGIGATGGHGPVRYYVEAYTPGRSIRFRFTGPAGFDGFHGYDLVETDRPTIVLRHRLEMETRGPAILSWPLVFRPLHNALIEDSLAMAQDALGQASQIHPWSLWVKTLRWAVSRGRAGGQDPPGGQSTAPTVERKRL